MSDVRHDDERLLDLLALRATAGLDTAEAAELERLLAASPEAGELETAAAAVDLALQASDPEADAPLPAALRETIVADGARRVAGAGAPAADLDRAREERRRRGVGAGTIGWLVAAAALIVAVTVGVRDRDVAPVPPAERRAELLEREGTLRVAWNRPEIDEYRDVEGDVVWNTALQEGYLRLRNLPANDPAERQYQLWIVDPARDAEPVDGGVFDVPAGAGEVVVPIHAKLGVVDPAAFAITSEQPGGVVVSEGPLLVVAPV